MKLNFLKDNSNRAIILLQIYEENHKEQHKIYYVDHNCNR